MVEIVINGEKFNAETYDCHPTSANVGDKVQTQDGVNHVESQLIKLYIKASFPDFSKEETARFLQVIYSSVYPSIEFMNPFSNRRETKLFILQNNPSIPVVLWRGNLQYYKGIEIELLEKGASRYVKYKQ
jgi:hypothetical protein